MLKLQLFLVALLRKNNTVRNGVWTLRKAAHAVKRTLLVRRPLVDGTDLIKNAILSGIPYAVGKMGSTEAAALKTHIKRKGKRKPAYPKYIFYTLFVNSGVFPQNEDFFDKFCAFYLDVVRKCDALVAWDVAGEAEILARYCQKTDLIHLRDLEPYFFSTPWSCALSSKRVLVLSPFTKSIEQQYALRKKIWLEKNVLPDFTLLTLRMPLSAGLVPPESKDWFEALDRIKKQMDFLDYDVALIGAGSFSLPLALHAKRAGKVGIHLGGSLQILFGIIGKRWKEDPDFKSFINASWTSPLPEETPPTINTVENGCYW